jgi:putative ABC transport system permease protein
MLGVGAAAGRTFATGEDQPGHDRVVVLSHRFWLSRFSADPEIIGRPIQLDGQPYTVIGILPAGGPFDRAWAQVWYPLAFSASEHTRNYHWLRATARLKPGVTFEQAQANMDAIGARIARDYPDSNKDWGVHVDRLDDVVVDGNLRTSLDVLLAAVGLLLLLGCANLANLSLARGAAREQEVLVRAALGASRGRILRQFLTESVVLAATGGAVGVAVGYLMMSGLKTLLPPLYLPREAMVAMNGRALAFAATASIATGVLFGIAPALQASRLDLAGSMRSGSRSATGDRSRRRLRDGLVVVEIGIACLLLVGTGLLGRSFFAMQRIDVARDPDQVLTAGLSAAQNQFASSDQARTYYRQVLERVSALPGVASAALTSSLPLEGWTDGMPFKIAGRPDITGGVGFKRVTPAYFSTIGLSIVRGRGLTDQDRHGTTPVIVVDEQFVARYFPNRDPLGEHVLMEEIVPGQPALGPEIPWEIVGVVTTERVNSLNNDGFPGSYATIEQAPTYGLSAVLRAAADTSLLVPALRAAVKEIDPDQPVTDIRTISEIKSEYVAPDRLRTWLLSAFSTIALVLAIIGIYGVISYSVAQRTREIGIRTALGATRSGIVALVLRQAAVTIAVGLAIGTAAALALTGLMANLLFGVQPRDPVGLASAAAILAASALAAAYLPARRAAQLDPIKALRID